MLEIRKKALKYFNIKNNGVRCRGKLKLSVELFNASIEPYNSDKLNQFLLNIHNDIG